jgi:hypothetical protein
MKKGDRAIMWAPLGIDDQRIGFVVCVVGKPKDGSILVQSSFLGDITTHQILKEDISSKLSEIKE